MIPFQSHRLNLEAFRMLADSDRDPGPMSDWLQEQGVGLFDVALLFGQGADLKQECRECLGGGAGAAQAIAAASNVR
jgi:hypothetical protein